MEIKFLHYLLLATEGSLHCPKHLLKVPPLRDFRRYGGPKYLRLYCDAKLLVQLEFNLANHP